MNMDGLFLSYGEGCFKAPRSRQLRLAAFLFPQVRAVLDERDARTEIDYRIQKGAESEAGPTMQLLFSFSQDVRFVLASLCIRIMSTWPATNYLTFTARVPDKWHRKIWERASRQQRVGPEEDLFLERYEIVIQKTSRPTPADRVTDMKRLIENHLALIETRSGLGDKDPLAEALLIWYRRAWPEELAAARLGIRSEKGGE